MKIRKANKASGNAQFLPLSAIATAIAMTLFLALDDQRPTPDTIHRIPVPSDYAANMIHTNHTTPIERKVLGDSYLFSENDSNSSIYGKDYPAGQTGEKAHSPSRSPIFEKTTTTSVKYSDQNSANSEQKFRAAANRTERARGSRRDSEPASVSWDRMELAGRLETELTDRKLRAWELAQSQGWSPVGTVSEDAGYELMAIENGSVYTYETSNKDAAISTAVKEAIAGAPVPIDGGTQTAGVWDQGGVLSTHQEFGGRVTIRDGAYPSSHATHVGGTIAAQGINESATGMAPGAQIASYDWSNDLAEMTEEAMSYDGEPEALQVSSHSYGFVSGWALSYSPPRWYGNADEMEAANFGLYDWYAEQWDELCYNAPYYLPFKSAGNNRIDRAPTAGTNYRYYDNGWQTKPYDPATDPAGDDTANDGYDTIPLLGNAKNVMTVGAVDDAVANGERSLEPAAMMQFSGWGPTDDGRIKPDIVANGALVYSARATADDAYGSMSGTSMATPNAAGSALLLLDLHQKLFDGSTMPAC